MGYHLKIKLKKQEFEKYDKPNVVSKNYDKLEITVLHSEIENINEVVKNYESNGFRVVDIEHVGISNAYVK